MTMKTNFQAYYSSRTLDLQSEIITIAVLIITIKILKVPGVQ